MSITTTVAAFSSGNCKLKSQMAFLLKWSFTYSYFILDMLHLERVLT